MQSPDALPCTPPEAPLTAKAMQCRDAAGQGCRTASAVSRRVRHRRARCPALCSHRSVTAQPREGFTTVLRHAAKDSQCEASQASPASCWVLKAAVA